MANRVAIVDITDTDGQAAGHVAGTEVTPVLTSLRWTATGIEQSAVECLRIALLKRVRDVRADTEYEGVLIDGGVFDIHAAALSSLSANLAIALRDVEYSGLALQKDGSYVALDVEGLFRVFSGATAYLKACSDWENELQTRIADTATVEALQAIRLDTIPRGLDGAPPSRSTLYSGTTKTDKLVTDALEVNGDAQITGALTAGHTVVTTLESGAAQVASLDAGAGLITTTGDIESGAARVTSLDSSGPVTIVGPLSTAGTSTLTGGLVVDGGSRIDGVYTRVYDLTLAATANAYTDICEIAGEHGARTILVEVVQSVHACSLSRTYMLTNNHAIGTYDCIPVTSSGPWGVNDIGLEQRQDGWNSRLYIKRIGGSYTTGIRVCVRAISSVGLTFAAGTRTGTLNAPASATQSSTVITQVNGRAGIGTRTPSAKLHVAGAAILDSDLLFASRNSRLNFTGPSDLASVSYREAVAVRVPGSDPTSDYNTLVLESADAMLLQSARVHVTGEIVARGRVRCESDLKFTSYNSQIQFAGISDTATIQYFADDESADNPWRNSNSTQNSALVITVGDDVGGVHGDSIRLKASTGIVLDAEDRVIVRGKLEAQNGIDALDELITTSGPLSAGTTTLGTTTAASLDAGAGSIKTTGTLASGAATVTSLDAQSGAIKTRGPLESGISTMGATSVASLDAGTGAIKTTGPLTSGVAAVTTLSASSTLSVKGQSTMGGDLVFDPAATRMVKFQSSTNIGSDYGSLKFISNDTSADNLWGSSASGENSVLELKVGDDSIDPRHADSIRVDGAYGILLKATEVKVQGRTSAGAKFEVAGTLNSGAATVASLDAKTGFIRTTGTLDAGVSTMGATSVASLNAGSGSISTSGTVSVGDPTIIRDALTVYGGCRFDGVYMRSYDLQLSATADAYTDIFQITSDVGSRVVTIELVQGVDGSSQAHRYVVAEQYRASSTRYACIPYASSGKYLTEDIALEVTAFQATSTFRLVRVSGSRTAVRASVRVACVGTPTLVAGTATGVLPALAAGLHPSTALTQVNGNVGIGTRSPTATLQVVGKTVLGMTTIAAPNTRVPGGGVADPLFITGSGVAEAGVWGTYDKILRGGDLMLSAGDAESIGNNGSAPATIRGGDVYLRAGRASNAANDRGNEPRTYGGAIVIQSGVLRKDNNLDKDAYVTMMKLQDGKVGIGVDDLYAKLEALQVHGGILATGGGITTTGSAVVSGNVRAGTLTVDGDTTTAGDLQFTSYDSKIGFAGASDTATIQYLQNDDSAANPWANAASAQNSALVISVGDDRNATDGDSIRLDASRGIVLAATDRVVATCQIEARGGLNALDQQIVTTGALRAGTVNASSLDAGSGTIRTTGAMEAGTLAVEGDVRAGQIHIRSYSNLKLETAVDSYTEICSISTTHGARTVHIDLVQSTADGSHSMTYVLAEQHEDAQSYWECLPTSTSGPWRNRERISLEVYTFNATSVFALKRVEGTHRDDIVAVVKVASVTVPQITQRFGKGTRAAYSEVHPCAHLTQINGMVGIGLRDPTAKLHVKGNAILTGDLSAAAATVASLDAAAGVIQTTGSLRAGATTLGDTSASSVQTTGALKGGTTTLGATSVASLNAAAGTIQTTGALKAGAATLGDTSASSVQTTGVLKGGTTTLGATGASSLDTGPGTIQTTGALKGGPTTLGATSAASLNTGAGTIQTTGSLKGGTTTLGSTNAASLDTGAGTIQTTGSLKGGITTLGVTSTTSLNAGTGTVQTTGALKGGITTLGATSAASLDAGTGTIETTGDFRGGRTTLGATSVTSLDAGSGTVQTTGAVLSGALEVDGPTRVNSVYTRTISAYLSGEQHQFNYMTKIASASESRLVSVDIVQGEGDRSQAQRYTLAESYSDNSTTYACLPGVSGGRPDSDEVALLVTPSPSGSEYHLLRLSGSSAGNFRVTFRVVCAGAATFNEPDAVEGVSYGAYTPEQVAAYLGNPHPSSCLTQTLGNVGVGTRTPTSKLHVAGDTLLAGGVRVAGTVIADSIETGELSAGELSAGDVTVTSLDAGSGLITTTGRMTLGNPSVKQDALQVDGGCRFDGVYMRSYDVQVSAEAGAYADIFQVTSNGGSRVVTIDLTQGTSGSSQSQRYVIAERYTENSRYACIPYASSGKFEAEELGLDVVTVGSESTFRAVRITGTRTGVRASVRVACVGEPTFVTGSATGVATPATSSHPSTALTQVDGYVGIGVRSPTVPLHVVGKTILGMATISAPNTRVQGGGTAEPLIITGSTVNESGVWGTYDRLLRGGDLIMSAGDGESYGNDGSAPATIRGGDVYLRAGRASNTGNSKGDRPHTYSGALVFQSGLQRVDNNLDRERVRHSDEDSGWEGGHRRRRPVCET